MKSKLLNQCLNIALKNNNENHPQWNHYIHYSFLIQHNKIIGWGTNRKGSSFTFLGYKPFQKIHSEIDCYFKTKYLIDHHKSFEVVNIRLNKKSQIKASDPCSCCVNFLHHVGCKAVWFTTNIENFASIRF